MSVAKSLYFLNVHVSKALQNPGWVLSVTSAQNPMAMNFQRKATRCFWSQFLQLNKKAAFNIKQNKLRVHVHINLRNSRANTEYWAQICNSVKKAFHSKQ